MMTFFYRILIPLVALTAVAAAVPAEAQTGASPSIPVTLPTKRTVSDTLTITGNAAAVSQVKLVARVLGFLEKIHFEDGALVRKGDLLFTIQQDQYKAQLQQAQAKIGGAYFDLCNGMSKTTDGGYIMTGWTDSYGQGNGDVYIIKLDSNAHITWTKTIGGTQNDGGSMVIQTADGGYAIDSSHRRGE